MRPRARVIYHRQPYLSHDANSFEPEIPEIAVSSTSLSQSEFPSSSHSAHHRLASGAGVARRTAVPGPEHARRPPRTGSALAPPSRPDLPPWLYPQRNAESDIVPERKHLQRQTV